MSNNLPKDDNSRSSEDDYSLMILKNRLAKGEITIDEFNVIKKIISENEPIRQVNNDLKNVHEKLTKIQQEQNLNEIIQNEGKSQSTTLVLSLILGLIGLQGIGHIYAKKIVTGTIYLIFSFVLFVTGIFVLSVLGGDAGRMIGGFIFLTYFIMYLLQIFGARNACYEYNLEIYRSNSSKYSHDKTGTDFDNTKSTSNKKRWSKKIKFSLVIICLLIILYVPNLFMTNNITQNQNQYIPQGSETTSAKQLQSDFQTCIHSIGGNPSDCQKSFSYRADTRLRQGIP